MKKATCPICGKRVTVFHPAGAGNDVWPWLNFHSIVQPGKLRKRKQCRGSYMAVQVEKHLRRLVGDVVPVG
jgi:hypothetical protein